MERMSPYPSSYVTLVEPGTGQIETNFELLSFGAWQSG